MKNHLSVIFIFLFFIGVSIWALEIESSDISDLSNHIYSPLRIKTIQRGIFQGILKEVSDDRVEIIARDGQIILIDLASVESYVIFDDVAEEDTFFQDSASNRLIVLPTGFPMDRGEFHVANQEIAALTMSYGLNEHVSFWSGISIPGLLLNARYIASLSSDFAVSFGSFAGFSWINDGDSTFPGILIPYTIASRGEPNNNITVGGGPVFMVDRGWSFPGCVLVIGGKKVLTSTTSLIFENWIIWGERTDYGPMVPLPLTVDDPPDGSYDDRWSPVPTMIFPAICFRIANERISWDVGVVVPLILNNSEEVEEGETHYWKNTGYRIQGIGEEAILPLPILSVTYRID